MEAISLINKMESKLSELKKEYADAEFRYGLHNTLFSEERLPKADRIKAGQFMNSTKKQMINLDYQIQVIDNEIEALVAAITIDESMTALFEHTAIESLHSAGIEI